ncbi:lipopolysaccharide biosynthesis protein [Pedobacter sp. MC2016-24]|uniref:lipopolysaccharide biosynthesis protein n=1 Tax=Pedobacter sp. MC2016-24 TaxID=2780090 RepID=UPI0018810705|nr:lipopolysaccharide biosynthesis protein [Pedobacter sp. MC2016-24]MBE9600321.1 lipopolysaccharide biosynthesis protein [Pedobacter sp. MC2016-24]
MDLEKPKEKQDHYEMSLKELIFKINEWTTYLLSKWMLILSFGILGAVIGFAYTYSRKIQYTATTTFVLEEDKVGGGGLGSIMGLASMAGMDINGGGGLFQGDNILALYRSRSMIVKTLLTEVSYQGTKVLLVDRYIDINNLRKTWAEKGELKDLIFKPMGSLDRGLPTLNRVQDSILSIIVNDINKNYLNVLKPDKKLSIIKADVKSSNEFFSKSFNDQIVKNVSDFYIQTKTRKSMDNVKILQQKVDSVRAVMDGAIYTAAFVADATPNLNPTRTVQRLAPIQKSQFSAETNKGILLELVKNLELSKISLRKETPLIQVVDSPTLPLPLEGRGRLMFMVFSAIGAVFIGIVVLVVKKYFRDIMAKE